MKAGSVFDNILICDDQEYARMVVDETWGANRKLNGHGRKERNEGERGIGTAAGTITGRNIKEYISSLSYWIIFPFWQFSTNC